MGETLQGFLLSPQQERLWELARATGQPFRACLAMSLAGEVDAAALRAALLRVVARHEILRTRFALLPGMRLPCQVPAETETALAWAESAAAAPAAPADGPGGNGGPEQEPVVHARLERQADGLHRLRLELPALCADAQSLVNLAREIGHHYGACRRPHAAGDGGEPGGEPGSEPGAEPGGEPVQYADFAGWQREVAERYEAEARKLWHTPGLAEALRARLPGSAAADGDGRFVPRTLRFALPAAAVERLAAAGGPPAAPAAVVLAAWVLLLQRHLGMPGVTVGVAVAGRGFAELRQALGLFCRHLPCALEVPETAPLAAVAASLGGSLAELAARQEWFPWEGLDLPAGTPRYFPFGFEWRELPPAWQVAGVDFSCDEVSALVDRFAVRLAGVRRGAELQAELLYDAAVIAPAQAELLAGRLVALLRDAALRTAVPAGELELLTAGERRQLLVELNRTDDELAGGATLAAVFEARARTWPHGVALVAAGDTLTCGELEARANRLARHLRRLGVGPEVPVALHLDRSFDLVIALLAVAKAGGAWVPVDPELPDERQRLVLADSGASLLLSGDGGPRGAGLRVVSMAARPAAGESAVPLPPVALPQNLAYVIYTSGSTGRPKGVMVSHAAIVNRLLWMQRDFPLAAGDRVLQKTPYSFDASIWEIFVPLLAGAQVVLAEPGGHQDSRYLLDAVMHHGVTVLQLVPSQLAAFVDQPGVAEACRSLRRMFCGGEALPGAVAARWLGSTGSALCNLYGPTEAAIDASFQVCLRGTPLPDVVPIGRPLANVRIYLVDRLQRPVPPPAPGEIVIGGAGLARGYLGRPELTAERFVPNPFGPPGDRLYRTGDLGRLGPGGAIEFLGRIDHQVKLRGVRIEPGEIEARLREHPAVQDAVVLLDHDARGEPRLVGFVVRGEAARRDDLCELPGGLRIACVNRHEAEVLHREIFAEGAYLRHGVELPDGACVVDVGANVGLFTLYVKQRCPASRVLAFEPIPAIFDKLRANVALHALQQVELFACALAEREGTAPYTFYPGWSAMSGRYADIEDELTLTRTVLAREPLGAADVEALIAGRFAGEVVECPQQTLSQVLREHQVEWIDLLKIDVEKSELDVLRGIAAEDWGRIGQIVIEVHDLDGRLETVRSLLAAQGFAVAVDQDDFLAGTPIWNLYGVRPGRRKPSAAGTVPAAVAGTGAASRAVAAGAPADLRAWLAARLPAAMVPAAIRELDALPRLPSGKVDRKALAALAPEPPAPAVEPPRTPVEALLAEMVAGVLERRQVGVHDDFFELGGHSLLATRLLSRVRTAFEVEVPLRGFFDQPTVAGLAALVGRARESGERAAPPILAAGRDRELPLSFAQQRLWFIDQLQPGNVNYNLPMTLRITGRLELGTLGRTLSEVVRRHEVLRTRFPAVSGRGVQVIEAPRPVRLPLLDLAALPWAAGEAEALRLAQEDARRPFDLGRGGLLRVAVVRLDASSTEHLVLLAQHHIISDAWSTEVLAREVSALYAAFAAGRPSPLPELRIQFADYALWQREWLSGEELQSQLGFWREQLSGAPQVLDLPLDRRRPAVQSGRSMTRSIELPGLGGAVHELCRREGATVFMVLLGAWTALLGRLAGQRDVLVGSPIAGRHRQELEGLIGLFVNTLVMRADFSGAPGFAELLGRIRRMALDAWAHQDLPFERLVEELVAERNLAHAPLYQVLFGVQTAPVLSLSLPGMTVRPLAVRGGSVKVDLVLVLEEREAGFLGGLEYDAALFDGATIARLGDHLGCLLGAALAEPSRPVFELPLLGTGERHQLLAEWNDTAAPWPGAALLHQPFEAAVERAPRAVAAVCRGRQLSYGELEARSNRLAYLLRCVLGLPRGGAVGVWMERSLDMVVAVLGVLKAGGHYVALDESWPAERVETILGATGARALIAGGELLGRVEEMRWRLAALLDVICPGIGEAEPPAEAVDETGVRELWDLVAERAVDRVTAGGFVSALTGEPMSEAEVDEYRDRVLGLAGPWLGAGSRVLEIGNGSGLLLWEMARLGAAVTGIDPSPLTQERNRAAAAAGGMANVRLLTGFAHELEELLGADERFDLVLLASTVQFFPGPRYLERVLRQALGRLAAGGALLVADVLDARRRGELRRAIAERLGAAAGAGGGSGGAAAERRELYVDEGFFAELGATIHHRGKGFANELGFRYDVLLTAPGLVPETRRRRRLWTGAQVEGCPAERLPAVASPEDVAYVMHTSGSTGEPKGIVVQHRPAVNLVDWVNRSFGVGPRDRGLFVASLAFDLSVYDIFGLLAAGGTVQVASREELADPDRLVSLLRSGGITLWDSAPAALVQLAPLLPAVPVPSSRLRRVLLSGDWIPVTLPERVRRTFPRAQVLALGGATEATVWSNWYPVGAVDPGWPSIPYGRPIANARYHVLDGDLGPCAIGVPGDLYIGGGCLAAGYTRAELTAASFVPDPHSGVPGARLYRTGDRARYYADGNLEFLGRVDQQVKVRGFRIELGEIEVVLGSHPGVRDAVVVAREDLPGDRRLVAYVVARRTPSGSGGAGGQPPRDEELKSHLSARLPDYMVPGAFVWLEALPLTANGKLDRQALPAPERTAAWAAPADPVEELVAGIWAEVLGQERISVHDNFFDLGGHSLLATQVASWIRSVLRVELPLRQLFETPTIGGLAAALREREREASGPAAPPLVPLPRETPELPLSFAQQRLWFLHRLDPGGAAYNVPVAVRLRGVVAVPELAWIFAAVARRHEVLRTTFAQRGQGAVQVVGPATAAPALPIVDLSGLLPVRREPLAQALALEAARRPFDLERGPLLRLSLLRLGERDHLLLMALHHIISDGWSLGVLTREIAALLEILAAHRAGRAAAAPLPALPVQYADFARWQRQWLSGEVLEAQLAYWRQQLAGAPRVLALPLDHPRPARQTFRGAVRGLELPPRLGPAVRGLCRREAATPFMFLLAAWGLLLGRHAGQADLLLGAPIAGRNRREIENLVGCFVNTLVLRIDLRGAPGFVDLLGRVRTAALDGYTHQDLPFERLVDDLAEERGLAVSPLFQAVLVLQNAALPGGRSESLSAPGLTLAPLPLDLGTAKFDLTLALDEDGLTGTVEYNTDLFDRPTIDRLVEQLATLLSGTVAEPRAHVWEIPLLGPEQRSELLSWSGAGESWPPAGSLAARFEAVAAARPHAVAARCAGASVTYGELDRQANRLAHRLLQAGVAPGSRVCLAVDRGLGMVAAILGILKAGCAYVPLDPSYPEERLAWMLDDAGAAALVSEAGTVERLPAWPGRRLLAGAAGGLPESARVPAAPGWPAYVIYTSGSTGHPKGVVVSHGNVLRLMDATEGRFGFGSEDVWTLFHSFAFDFSVWELWGALLYGGRLVVVPYLASRSPQEMLDLVEQEGVTVLNQTPSAFQGFQQAEARWPAARARSLRWVIFGGETLVPRSLEGFWRRRERQGIALPGLVNMYGITETTVHVTFRRLGAAEILGGSGSVVGAPLGDLRVYVLDPWGQPVPPGVGGELHVGGDGVALGYLGRPGLTAERFVPDGFGRTPGARLYRSGDLARWRGPGELEYLGRIDHQVKVRGFRIEPGEIETVLRGQPGVWDCVVLAREDAAGERRLVAWVVGPAARGGELRRRLQAVLPEHMVPSAFVSLPALPLTPNGKVDRQALPAPGEERPELGTEYVAPRAEVEELLAAIWSRVLSLDRVSVHDNFFALGGDSILSLQVVALARERGLMLELAELFEHPTPAELAAWVRRGGPEEARSEPLSLVSAADRAKLPAGVEDAYPLALMQAGMLYHMDLAPDDPPYHNIDSWHLRAHFDRVPLQRAVDRVLARHPVLRTSFDLTGYSEPVQLVHARAHLPVPVIDLTGLDATRHGQVLAQFVAAEKRRLLDRSRPPQLRFHVHLRTADSFQLTLTENHAILDGWSLHATLAELFDLYFALLRGEDPPPAPPLASTFRDFVALERQTLASPAAEACWAEVLDGAPFTAVAAWPEWPRERQAPRVRMLTWQLPPATVAGLHALARQASTPFKSVLLAAHLKTLAVVAAEGEVVSGLVTNGRLEVAGGDDVRGLFLNTLPLRLRLPRGSWLDLIRDAARAELSLLPHRRYPLAALQRRRDQPLFEVIFNFIHFHVARALARAREMAVIGGRKAEGDNFKLGVNFTREPAGEVLALELDYDSRLLPRRQVEAYGELLLRALQAMVEQPDALHESLPVLTPAGRHQLLVEWNDTGRHWPDVSLDRLVAAQAARRPDAVAVEGDGWCLSHAELEGRAHQLARRLRALGVDPAVEAVVGVCMDSGPELIVALLGVLKAGAAYLPMDPDFPAARLQAMIEGARPAVLLTSERFLGRLPAVAATLCLDRDGRQIGRHPRLPCGRPASPEHTAYVIFTSGSTGRPKGIAISHRAAAGHSLTVVDVYGLRPGDRVLQLASISFDLSIEEIFPALAAGATLVLATPEARLSATRLLALAAARQLTVLLPSTALWHEMASEVAALPAALPPAVRQVIIGSEEASPAKVAAWCAAVGSRVELHNAYGPTEATIGATACRLSEDRAVGGDEPGRLPPVPIGRAQAGRRTYVLDDALRPVPPGAPGELCLGGALSRGYLGLPGETAACFVPDALSGEPGARLYRTRDRARFGYDGTLTFLGRLDHQVKLRGFRVELGEVEAMLARQPGVRAAVVLARDSATGLRLVACVVAQPGATPAPRELREGLERQLPRYMVPAEFHLLERLPLTSGGKVDRAALLRLAAETRQEPVRVAPRTATEALLAEIAADVLGLPEVSVHDDFFELGGHSLLAIRLLSRVRAILEVEVPLRGFFDAPTVAGLAAVVARAREAGLRAAPPIVAAGRDRELPLSFAQQRLWFIDQLQPGNVNYNILMPLRISGRLELPVLARTLSEVVRRHEVLRTRFPAVGGRGVQVIEPPRPVRPPLIDLAALPPAAAEAAAQRLAEEDARRPFDLGRGGLLRIAVVRLDAEATEHLVLLAQHHVISDAWSTEVLAREVSALYGELAAGRPSPLPELPIQYADFAVWQREWLQGEELANQLAFWREQLAGAPQVLNLPLDRQRPAVQSGRSVTRGVTLPGLAAAVHELCRREGVTVFMVLLGAWTALLGRLAGQRDVLVGSPIAGRHRQELEGLIGLFVNTLVMRTDLSGSPGFGELLGRIRRMALDAYTHPDLPFERLVAELVTERNLAHAPLCQVLFGVQAAPMALSLALPGMTVQPLAVRSGSVKVDLVLGLEQWGGGFAGGLEYDAALFDGATIERLAGHLGCLLAGALAEPSRAIEELPLLGAAQRAQLVWEWNQPVATAAAGEAPLPLHRLFEAQAARRPLATAVVHDVDALTYGELDERANRLARRLRGLGVGPGARVGLCAERSLDMIVGLLAILKAGGAYLPLDPTYPHERLAFMLADAGAALVLTQERLRDRLPQLPPADGAAAGGCRVVLLDGEEGRFEAEAAPAVLSSGAGGGAGVDEKDLPGGAGPDDIAYVIYTSGSTGTPKGVEVSHANVARLLTAAREWFDFGPNDVWTLFHSYAFDFSVWEIWGALAAGGQLVVVPYDVSRTPAAFLSLLATERVTVLNQTPSAFRQLVQAACAGGGPVPELGLRWVIFGGEALDPRLLAPWIARYGDEAPRLVNMYGITETTVHVTYQRVRASDLAAAGGGSVIGRPIPDLSVHLLDRRLHLLPPGAPGEIHVGGAGVARGYLGRPELTAGRFLPDPWSALPGSRLYRTGDLARRLPDGRLEYLGRTDSQVKIRGFRIELGEIEAALGSHPAVAAAVVEARWDPAGAAAGGAAVPGGPAAGEPATDGPAAAEAAAGGPAEPRLVAWVVAAAQPAPTTSELRAWLGRTLPDHMLPAAFVFLPALPLTPSGKVDRRVLPAPERVRPELEAAFGAPRTPAEELLAALWCDVLDLEQVGVEDNFFALGGHSLLATRVTSRIQEVFGVTLPLRAFFDAPTVAGLGVQIEILRSAGAAPQRAPLGRADRSQPLPASFAQQRLWFMDQLDPGSAAYNMPAAAALTGRLDVAALAAALSEVVQRHEVLRTHFAAVGGEPVQIIAPRAAVALPLVDLGGLPAAVLEGEAGRVAEAEVRRPFDLAQGPLLRSALLRLAAERHAILLTMHHIVSDGWSQAVLVEELGVLYEAFRAGRPSPLPSLPVQYADFAVWQRQWLAGERLAEQLAYWTRHLDGAPPLLALPYDRPRPSRPRYRGGAHPFRIPREVTVALKALGRREGTTLFMTLLAAWSILLHRYSGQSDLVVGSNIANRRLLSLEGLIGLFANTVALRVAWTEEPTVRELLVHVRRVVLEAQDHQDFPFEKLVEALRPERDETYHPLFQVMLVMQESLPRPAAQALAASQLGIPVRSSKFDLTLYVMEEADQIAAELEYDADLFDAATVADLAGQLAAVLQALPAAIDLPISAVPLASAPEAESLVGAFVAGFES
jgi:amino acid adenylation domain-containing protein/FkbM family methyltransferase